MHSWPSRLNQHAHSIARLIPAPPAIRIAADLVFRAFRNFSRDDGSHMAAGVAYYAVFSMFPLVLATIAIAGYVLADSDVEQGLLKFLEEQLPGSGNSAFVRGNIETLANARGTFSILAMATLLWSGRAVFGAIHRVLNRAWKVTEPPHFLLYQLGQMAAAAGVVLLFVSSAVLGTVGRAIAAQTEVLPVHIPWETLFNIIPFVLSTVLFVTLYRVVPDTVVRWRDAVPAGVIAGMAFELTKVGFSYYLANLSSLDLVYGSVTTIVVLLLFLYVVALILVWGAELASEISRTSKAGMLDIKGHLVPIRGGLASVAHRGSSR
jgi:membrane protein